MIEVIAKYQRYAEYKDSGIEWLGEIPSHWTATQVKYGYQVTLGKMLQSTPKSFHDELKPYLKAQNIQPIGISVNQVEEMWFSADERKKLLLVKDDVLVSEGGDVGRSAIWNAEIEECYIQNAINRVRPKSNNSSKLFLYWIGFLKSTDFINIICNKATIAHYTAEKLETSPLVLPSSDEQTQIANFLDHETAKIDSLIEKQKQLIQLLKEKRQAVISHAVTKGLDPSVKMKDSGVEWLREVPEHWELPKLFYITNRIGDGLHSTPVYQDGTGYYFINGNNLIDGKISIGETAKEVPESEYIRHQVTLNKTTVLLSINGTIGKIALFDNEPVILGKSAAYINCQSNLLPVFLANFLATSEARKYYDLEVTGTTIFNLSLNSIRNMKIPLPPLDEQIKITGFVSKQFLKYKNLIDAAEKQNNLLQERRTALISAAVTGKIDVRDWQNPTEAKMECSA